MARFGLLPSRDRGDDPDYRFSFANERTFLAGIRTSLAVIAAGLALVELMPRLSPSWARQALGALLVLTGMALAVSNLLRWVRSEDAMRASQPLPASRMPMFTTGAVVAVALVTVVLLLGSATG